MSNSTEREYDIVEIPSQGYLYGDKLPEGKVSLYLMGTKEESLLAGRKGRSDASEILDDIIDSCLKTDFDVKDFLVTDRLFLLLMLRKISYGSEYSFELECNHPSCNFKFKHTVNIPGSFTIHMLDEDVKEPFHITLPRSGKKVGFRLLRVNDEREVQKYATNEYRKSLQKGDPAYQYRMAKQIVSVDGEKLDVSQALDFIQSLVGSDSAYLKTAYSKADCGIDITIQTDCPSCGREIKTYLQFDEEFFRPDTAEVSFE